MKKSITFLSLLALAGCSGLPGSSGEPKMAGEKEPIKIGVINVLSGPFASFGELLRSGIDAGLPAGTQAIIEDEGCEPMKAVTAFKALTDFRHVQYLIGPTCGSSQEAVAPLMAKKDVIAISSVSASQDIFPTSGGKFFQMLYPLEKEGSALGAEVARLGYSRVAIVRNNNAFTEKLLTGFKQTFTGAVISEFARAENTPDFRSDFAILREKNPDAIVILDGGSLCAYAAKELRKAGITAQIFGQFSTESPDTLAMDPASVEGMIYSAPAGAESGAIYTELAHDAAKLLGETALSCDGEFSCVRAKLDAAFGEDGAMDREVVFKTIRDGKFVPLTQK